MFERAAKMLDFAHLLYQTIKWPREWHSVCVCRALQQFEINIQTSRGNSGKWSAAEKLLITTTIIHPKL